MPISAGTILPYSGSSAPSGFLLCYGQAISRSTYSTLFAVIGTTYGSGDGSTTFNIPDLRGRVPAGKDDMGGSAASRLTSTTMSPNGTTLGATGGGHTHTLSSSEMPSHNHTVYGDNSGATTSSIGGLGVSGINTFCGNVGTGTKTYYNIAYSGSDPLIHATGGDAAHNNVQPTLLLNYIIATENIDANLALGSVGIVNDGGGAVISTGNKGFLYCPYAGTITAATLIADQSGSCVIDVWKAAYPTVPTVANTITASAKPTLSSAQVGQDSTLTGWTTSVSTGDVIGFNVDSASTITRVALTLSITKA